MVSIPCLWRPFPASVPANETPCLSLLSPALLYSLCCSPPRLPPPVKLWLLPPGVEELGLSLFPLTLPSPLSVSDLLLFLFLSGL